MTELLASYWTLAGEARPLTPRDYSSFDFKNRVECAAQAGYSGIGVYIGDLDRTHRQYPYPEILRILSANGVKHVEIEYLANWYSESELDVLETQKVLLAAESLGAHHVKTCPPMVGNLTYSLSHLTDRFGILCEQADAYGTKIALEIQAGSAISTIETALSIVYGAGATNGGLLLDIWHFDRANIPYTSICTIPAEMIISVELCDAFHTQQGSILEDTLCHRTFCGEGELLPSEFIENVKKTGYDGFYAVEILSDQLRLMPLAEAAHKSFETTIKQF